MMDTKNSRDDDYLGYGVYADTLWARIETALNKDADGKAELGDDPLVVGIFGEWGAGKSKLLDLVLQRAKDLAKQREFNRSQYDGGYGLTVPVYFQPWKYEHETNLLVPMLLHILAALNETLKRGQTRYEGVTETAGIVWKKLFSALPSVVEGFEQLLEGVEEALEISEPTGATALFAAAKKMASGSKKEKKDDPPIKKSFRYHGDGRFYYEIHEHLKHVTRPKKHAPIRNGVKIDADIRINFVVFIDDLDRCLPEKAVSTLEMIKTVFNVESFAFVLALDEEVVERGIAHRYRDYSFKGKKPEMPITGFEYLEKIVHVPFRLPALTEQQAAEFVREYEKNIQPDANRRWFDAPVAQAEMGGVENDDRKSAIRSAEHTDLLPLALASFHAFVPRKLIRMVELMQQTANVSDARHKPLPRGYGSFPDPRVVLTFVLIQLFQPELFRLLRRKYDALSQLISGYSQKADLEDAAKLHPALFQVSDVSDIDLWAWVAEGSTAPCATDAIVQKKKVVDPIARIQAIANAGNRARAQQVRLPLVQHLVEFRSAQRHAFDVMRLLHTMHREMGKSALEIEAKNYFSLLGKTDDLPGRIAESATQLSPATAIGTIQISGMDTVEATATVEDRMNDPRPTQYVRDVNQLFSDWSSDQLPVQANLAGNNGLQIGVILDRRDSQQLLDLAQDWLANVGGKKHDYSFGASREILLRGLGYLAPFIARDYGVFFWDLVTEALPEPERDFNNEITDLAMLKRRELWADVRSTLGADDRFDGETLYGEKKDGDKVVKSGTALWLPKARHNKNSDVNEPIPGFVRVKSGLFPMGLQSEKNNRRKEFNIEHDFFIARTLTTVDQYAAFIAAKGYKNDDYWDLQGIAWRGGDDSKIEDSYYPELLKNLKNRTVEMRQQPMEWAKQRAHGARAVWGVNWFEARAYARWLDEQLGPGILKNTNIPKTQSVAGGRYRVMLPTESQWERAAKAKDFESAEDRKFPWEKSEKAPHLQANIRESEIKRASVVGLFPPNPLGASDLGGNLWEWQNHVYEKRGKYEVGEPIPKISNQENALVSGKDFDSSDCPALRGGSWPDDAVSARFSIRNWNPPGGWDNDVGFRVVMSLAKNEP
jgi:formylglycine-generating enzyme required for sulfatase activity